MVHITATGIETDDDFGSQVMNAEEAYKDLAREVASWEGVTLHNHAMGGVEFRYGGRQLGHLHSDAGKMATADLELPMEIRNKLVKSGRVRTHITDSEGATGWITATMGTVADIAFAIELFEICYDRAIGNNSQRSEE